MANQIQFNDPEKLYKFYINQIQSTSGERLVINNDNSSAIIDVSQSGVIEISSTYLQLSNDGSMNIKGSLLISGENILDRINSNSNSSQDTYVNDSSQTFFEIMTQQPKRFNNKDISNTAASITINWDFSNILAKQNGSTILLSSKDLSSEQLLPHIDKIVVELSNSSINTNYIHYFTRIFSGNEFYTDYSNITFNKADGDASSDSEDISQILASNSFDARVYGINNSSDVPTINERALFFNDLSYLAADRPAQPRYIISSSNQNNLDISYDVSAISNATSKLIEYDLSLNQSETLASSSVDYTPYLIEISNQALTLGNDVSNFSVNVSNLRYGTKYNHQIRVQNDLTTEDSSYSDISESVFTQLPSSNTSDTITIGQQGMTSHTLFTNNGQETSVYYLISGDDFSMNSSDISFEISHKLAAASDTSGFGKFIDGSKNLAKITVLVEDISKESIIFNGFDEIAFYQKHNVIDISVTLTDSQSHLTVPPYYKFNDVSANEFIFYIGNTYRFIRQDGGHPFFISDSGYEQPSQTLTITGDGSYNNGITQNQSFNVTIPVDFSGTITYYCTSHTSMFGNLELSYNTTSSNFFNDISQVDQFTDISKQGFRLNGKFTTNNVNTSNIGDVSTSSYTLKYNYKNVLNNKNEDTSFSVYIDNHSGVGSVIDSSANMSNITYKYSMGIRSVNTFTVDFSSSYQNVYGDALVLNSDKVVGKLSDLSNSSLDRSVIISSFNDTSRDGSTNVLSTTVDNLSFNQSFTDTSNVINNLSYNVQAITTPISSSNFSNASNFTFSLNPPEYFDFNSYSNNGPTSNLSSTLFTSLHKVDMNIYNNNITDLYNSLEDQNSAISHNSQTFDSSSLLLYINGQFQSPNAFQYPSSDTQSSNYIDFSNIGFDLNGDLSDNGYKFIAFKISLPSSTQPQTFIPLNTLYEFFGSQDNWFKITDQTNTNITGFVLANVSTQVRFGSLKGLAPMWDNETTELITIDSETYKNNAYGCIQKSGGGAGNNLDWGVLVNSTLTNTPHIYLIVAIKNTSSSSY